MKLQDNIEEQVNSLNGYVNEYYSLDIKTNGERMNELLKKITTILYYLENCRGTIHDLYQNEVMKLTDKEQDYPRSVAKAKVEADIKYPEMYRLRRLMSAGYDVVGALRSNISYLKTERQNIN